MKADLNEDLKFYLKDVAKSDVLSREGEVALFKRLSEGDESAREEIVRANLRFVIKIALSFSGRGVPVADLVQEGNIGLLDVIDKFDYRRGYRFSTYAAFWIRQAIQLALRKQCNIIRLPIRKSRFLGYVNEAIRNFSSSNGRAPTNEELANDLGVDKEQVAQLLGMRDSVLSLDMEANDETAHLMNTLRDDKTPSPFESCLASEKRERVAALLSQLSERERKVLLMRFGFRDDDSLSLRSTSKAVGMSQEGVRRVERKALKKLRRPACREMVAGLL